MQNSIANMIEMALVRGAIIVLGGIALCASILAAIGFGLVALYSVLAPALGPAGAAFATSGVALAVPVMVMLVMLTATRTWIRREAPAIAPTAVQADSPAVSSGLRSALDWIAENPRSATFGALSFGIAFGAYPDLRKTVLSTVEASLSEDRLTAG